MTNPTGVVSVEADGTRYTLRFGINAMCQIEETTGKTSAIDALGELQAQGERPSMRLIRSIFHAGLIEYHPALTEADAGSIMTSIGLDRASRVIGEAVDAAFPSDAESGASAEGNAPPRRERRAAAAKARKP